MLDKSLVLELEEEKPLVAPEQPMFSVAEVVDKASLHNEQDARATSPLPIAVEWIIHCQLQWS
jgi:hypothetical protein